MTFAGESVLVGRESEGTVRGVRLPFFSNIAVANVPLLDLRLFADIFALTFSSIDAGVLAPESLLLRCLKAKAGLRGELAASELLLLSPD